MAQENVPPPTEFIEEPEEDEDGEEIDEAEARKQAAKIEARRLYLEQRKIKYIQEKN